jgi:hypothetical protein
VVTLGANPSIVLFVPNQDPFALPLDHLGGDPMAFFSASVIKVLGTIDSLTTTARKNAQVRTRKDVRSGKRRPRMLELV